jgi:hypothetical protein
MIQFFQGKVEIEYLSQWRCSERWYAAALHIFHADKTRREEFNLNPAVDRQLLFLGSILRWGGRRLSLRYLAGNSDIKQLILVREQIWHIAVQG